MNYAERQEQQFAAARRNFAEHKVEYHQLDEHTAVLDWRKSDGSSWYYVRYVLDKNRLYITGDLGAAVVELTEPARLERLAGYGLGYFIKKISCSTDLYMYSHEAAYEELRENLIPEDCDAEEREEIEEVIKSTLDDLDHFSGWNLSDETYRELSDLDPDFWEWIGSTGRYVDLRVILWLVGLNMAYEQLHAEGTVI